MSMYSVPDDVFQALTKDNPFAKLMAEPADYPMVTPDAMMNALAASAMMPMAMAAQAFGMANGAMSALPALTKLPEPKFGFDQAMAFEWPGFGFPTAKPAKKAASAKPAPQKAAPARSAPEKSAKPKAVEKKVVVEAAPVAATAETVAKPVVVAPKAEPKIVEKPAAKPAPAPEPVAMVTEPVAAVAKAAPAVAPAAAALMPEDFKRPASIEKPVKPDDLKLISGVGPKLEGVLHGLGIYTFAQIAAWSPNEVAWVDDYLQFKGRIDRDDWIAQADALAAGGRDEYVKRFGKEPR